MHQTIDRRQNKVKPDEIDLKEIIKAISRYKISIFIITFMALLFASKNIYLKEPVYSSHTLIEVKNSDGNKGMLPAATDIIGSAFSNVGGEKVDKEIEILKTFLTNNIAIEKVNYYSRFFVQEGYKKVEEYNNIPIHFENLKIYDEAIENILIKINLNENGFTLKIENSILDTIKHFLFNTQLIAFDSKVRYPFNSTVKNEYFSALIIKDTNVTQNKDIFVALNTNNRNIFENIVARNLEITQLNQFAPLIQVTYKDTVRKRANEYAHALAESFILQSIEKKSKKNNRIIDFINTQLKEIKQKLDTSEQELEEYRIKHKAINSTIQTQTYMEDLSKIEVQLNKNKLDKVILEELLTIIKTTNNIDTAAPLLERIDNKSSLALINELQSMQTKAQALKNKYSSRYPQVIALNKQIKYLKNRVIKNIKRISSSIAQKDSSLTKLKDKYEEKIKDIPTQERKLINLKRDTEVGSKTYNYLLEKKSENEMMKVAILSDYEIIEHAYSSKHPVSLKPLYVLIAALLLGLIFGIIQALIRNFQDDRIISKEDLTGITSIPLYGVLPRLNQKEIKLEVYKDPKSPFAESYRSLRTNLQFSAKESGCTTILVSSTIMSEGKSTTSANLGAILQMADYKCIIINMDLRKPTLHTYFDIHNNLGMSTYLSGKNMIKEIIHPSIHPNLDIIPSGPIPPNPSELILSPKLDILLAELKETYDYIIIDSAPLGLVTDTMHLMQFADITLIVVREGYSRKIFISDLNILIEKHDLKNIGLVLNSVDMDAGTYGYGYGYGYGED